MSDDVKSDLENAVRTLERNHSEMALWLFGDGRGRHGLVQQFETIASEFRSFKSGLRWAIGLLATSAATGLVDLVLHHAR